MRKALGFFLVGLMVAGIAGCGGGGSSPAAVTGSPTISSLSELPKATSPMAAVTSSISSPVWVKNVNLKAATTGVTLATATISNFGGAAPSRGACETANQLKEAIGSAASADQIMCFVGTMNSNEDFQGLTDPVTGGALNVYDGEYHIFNLNITGATGAPDRVKMKIVKTGDTITDFKMWMCIASSEDSEGACTTAGGTWVSADSKCLVENEYSSQSISGSSVTMRGIGFYTDTGTGSSGWHTVDVTGTLNSSNVYTSKTITVQGNGNWGGLPSWQAGTLTQEPGGFTFSGYRKGSYDNDGGSGAYTDQAYGEGQMLGDTSTNIQLLAMGDGALKYVSAGTYTNSEGLGTYDDNGTDSWNGDTSQRETSNDYTSAATDGTLPTVDTDGIDIAFAGDEIWDCSGNNIITLPAQDEAALMTACSAYSFDNHQWIPCYTIQE